MKIYKIILSANSTAIAFFSLFSMCLVLFAYIAHPIEEIDNAERDGYVKKTEQLSNGEIPRDVYRPLLYPVLSAFLRLITNDSFRAAQLVSVISAIAIVWILYFFARKFLSDIAAFFCTSMLVLNFTFIHNAVLATTDMLFTALCLCVLFFAHSYFTRPRISVLLAMAFFFSMAFFTRYTAIYLLFPIAVSIFFATQNSIKLVVRATAAAGAAAIIFLLPNFVLSYDQFGSIMYTENLRNVAWKIGQHSYYAWPHYSQLPYDEIMEIVSSQWMQVLRIGAKSTIENFFGISGLLAPSHLFQSILYFGFIGGFGIAFVRGRWDIVLIFAVVISYISMIGFTFFPYPRIMLAILPLMYILVAYALIDFPRTFMKREEHFRYALLVLMVVLLAFSIRLPRQIFDFWERHPIAEVNAIKALSEKEGSGVHIMATIPEAWRHVEGGFSYLSDLRIVDESFNLEESEKNAAFIREMEMIVRKNGVNYIVYGALSRRNRPLSLLNRPEDAPEWLEAVTVDPKYVIYKVVQ